MTLNIYTDSKSTTKLSTAMDQTNPLSVALDGQTGGTIDIKLYVRNDNSGCYYTDITVQAVDLAGGWLVDGTKGFEWKLMAGETKPVLENWQAILTGNTITFSSDIGSSIFGDTVTYLPFWIHIVVPRKENIATFKSVALRITATEHLVG